MWPSRATALFLTRAPFLQVWIRIPYGWQQAQSVSLHLLHFLSFIDLLISMHRGDPGIHLLLNPIPLLCCFLSRLTACRNFLLSKRQCSLLLPMISLQVRCISRGVILSLGKGEPLCTMRHRRLSLPLHPTTPSNPPAPWGGTVTWPEKHRKF